MVAAEAAPAAIAASAVAPATPAQRPMFRDSLKSAWA
jgi:hypothetical protein